MKPLTLVEAMETAKDRDNKEIETFIKRFTKLSEKDAKKLKGEIEALGLLKLKEENIVKIVDLLPEDNSDLNKILIDASLSEDESNKILEVIKKYI